MRMVELKRYIIYATIEDEEGEDEIILAGEEDVVLQCPCGKAIIVEHWRAYAFESMDELVEYLVKGMSHLYKVKKIRIEEWG